jgi:hypothetical protein
MATHFVAPTGQPSQQSWVQPSVGLGWEHESQEECLTPTPPIVLLARFSRLLESKHDVLLAAHEPFRRLQGTDFRVLEGLS